MIKEIISPREEPNVILNGYDVKLPSNYIFIVVCCSQLVREASFCSGEWLMQRLRMGQSVKLSNCDRSAVGESSILTPSPQTQRT